MIIIFLITKHIWGFEDLGCLGLHLNTWFGLSFLLLVWFRLLLTGLVSPTSHGLVSHTSQVWFPLLLMVWSPIRLTVWFPILLTVCFPLLLMVWFPLLLTVLCDVPYFWTPGLFVEKKKTVITVSEKYRALENMILTFRGSEFYLFTPLAVSSEYLN